MKELFEEYGVIKTGHFKLTSGKHSGQYINKDAIYCIPNLFSLVVKKIYTGILNNFNYNSYDIITGPAIAGAVLAAPIALKLNKTFVYPEKAIESRLAADPNGGVIETKVMKFRRGYNKKLKGSRVLIVEDIITTGNSVERTIKAVKKYGGKVVGISAIWNREGWLPEQNPDRALLLSLIDEDVPSYWPDDCPYCQEGRVPLQNPKE